MTDQIWEDNLLEKKLEFDLKDLLKTLVAFANSVKPDYKATLLIGERDDGTVQGVTNPDNIQKQIRKESSHLTVLGFIGKNRAKEEKEVS